MKQPEKLSDLLENLTILEPCSCSENQFLAFFKNPIFVPAAFVKIRNPVFVRIFLVDDTSRLSATPKPAAQRDRRVNTAGLLSVFSAGVHDNLDRQNTDVNEKCILSLCRANWKSVNTKNTRG